MFDKLSSYNLVTNLVPGAILAVALRSAGIPIVAASDIAGFAITSYALGSLTNRLGSIALDPVLLRMGFLPQRDYVAYVEACNKDPKIENLVENANAFRTFSVGGILFFIVVALHQVTIYLGFTEKLNFFFVVLFFIIVFGLSYRRQNGYIVSRVNHHRAL